MSLAFKIAFLASSLLVVATLVLFFLVRDRIESAVVRREETRLDRTVKLAARELRTDIGHAASDVRVAARSPSMTGLIATFTDEDGTAGAPRTLSTAEWEDQLADVFHAMLAANSTYLQVRLVGIEDSGREILRLQRTPEGIVRVPENELEQKSRQPYFNGILSQEPGVIYVSDINLNREHGKIEVPHQPVVRVGTAVATKQNKVFGFVVINVNLAPLLEQIASFSIDPLDLYLTTVEGDYLSTPDSKKAFGFDLGYRFRIQEDMPWLAQAFRGGASLGGPRNYRDNDMIAHTIALSAGEDTKQTWLFVGTVDIKRAMADFLGFRYWLMGTVVFLIIVGSLGAIFFARRMTAPLRKLTAALKGVGEGQFQKEVEKGPAVNREFANLRSAFETMRKAIQCREQRLRDARAHIEAVVENAVSPIITIDERGQILHVNKAACDTFEYAADEMEGRNVSMLMPAPYREKHGGYIQNYLATGDAKVIGKGREVTGLRKDGTTFPIDLGVAEVMLATGRTFIGTVTDLSEIKALQEAKIERIEEALKLEKLKSEFVATINHELRTPLASIIGSLSLVVHERFGRIPHKARSMIDIAFTNGERLARLVNDILDLEKLAAGQMQFDAQDLDVNALLQDAARANSAYGQRYEVGIELRSNSGGLKIHADPNRILQALTNLISNAVKYSPRGASVILSAKRRGGVVRIGVADKGPGIPREFRGRVFQRFAQADSDNARRRGGTGLGLSITKALVEALGGSIGFETTEGKGTTFFIDLPAHAAGTVAICQVEGPRRAAMQ